MPDIIIFILGVIVTLFAVVAVILIGKSEAQDLREAGILDRLESFLARHSGGDDLGLRLRGEQLAAGVRFVRMIREGTYDLVVGAVAVDLQAAGQGSNRVQVAAVIGDLIDNFAGSGDTVG